MKEKLKLSSDCFELSREFELVKENDDNLYVRSDSLSLSILVKKGGYIPKSGLLLSEYLKNFGVEDLDVLDIGTGETGIIAQCLLSLGAKSVVATDYDRGTIAHAMVSSVRSSEIMWEVADIYPLVNKKQFDLIVSNPPQMPTQFEEILHDTSGIDGRKMIGEIINKAPHYLRVNGKLLLLCFDFLGIDNSWGRQKSLFQIAEVIGLKGRIVSQYPRTIREGGETEKNLEWIQSVYPLYNFQTNDLKQKIYNICIVEFVF